MGRGAGQEQAKTAISTRTYRLLGADGREYFSAEPGELGGHRGNRVYGRLDCPNALRWIAAGHYLRQRVFFADEKTALLAGYRPCGSCLPELYREWKRDPAAFRAARGD